MSVQFTNNSVQVKNALNDATIAYLYEVGGELETQVKRNTRVKTGQTKGSWNHIVDESKGVCTVGSPLENAIWEEFGTGEFAINGDGRKGGWIYKDEKGETHFTKGKKPSRAFMTAYTDLKPAIINRAKQVIGGKMNDH